MSFKTKTLSIFAGVFGVAVLSTAAIAQETAPAAPAKDKQRKEFKRGDMMGREFGRHGKRGGFGLRGIELSEAQKAQIKTIREANKPDQATITELKAIRDARKAGTELTADQKARMQTFRDQAQAKAKSVQEQVLAVLTPEQKTQLETQRTQMRERRKGRDFNRPSRGTPPTVEKPKTD